MDEIKLPDGHTAVMRESLAKTPRRLTKALDELQMRSAMALSGVPKELLNDAGDIEAHELTRAVAALPAEAQATFLGMKNSTDELRILALVSEWSYPFSVTLEGLADLPTDAYEVLAAEAEKRAGIQVRDDTLAAMTDPFRPSVALHD